VVPAPEDDRINENIKIAACFGSFKKFSICKMNEILAFRIDKCKEHGKLREEDRKANPVPTLKDRNQALKQQRFLNTVNNLDRLVEKAKVLGWCQLLWVHSFMVQLEKYKNRQASRRQMEKALRVKIKIVQKIIRPFVRQLMPEIDNYHQRNTHQ
jgi:hypothetical protein